MVHVTKMVNYLGKVLPIWWTLQNTRKCEAYFDIQSDYREQQNIIYDYRKQVQRKVRTAANGGVTET